MKNKKKANGSTDAQKTHPPRGIERDRDYARTGPYRFVRHPGYTGGVLLIAAMPLVLESTWGLFLSLPAGLLLVIRTALEDRMLQDALEGNREYAEEVPWKLVAFVW